MTSSTQGPVAVVTGASRGIGRACAERLAGDGYAVVVGCATQVVDAAEVVTAVQRAGGRAVAVAADVADERAVHALFDQAEQAFGGIDAVVHAAGQMTIAPLVDLDLTALDAMVRTNLRGTFVVGQQAARRLRDGGSLVNLSSSVIGRPLPGYTGYAATKGAVEAMTFVLAQELRGRDITVNAIAPGPTATDMFLQGKDEQAVAAFARAAPLERLGTPSDIAAAVSFLVGSAGHWVNGQTLRVNGGLH